MKTGILIAIIAAVAIAIVAVTQTPSAVEGLLLNPTPEEIASATPVHNSHCPVTGEAIGSMGGAVQVIYKGNAVQLCCRGCLKPFSENPEHFLQLAQSKSGAPLDSTSAGDETEHGVHQHENAH